MTKCKNSQEKTKKISNKRTIEANQRQTTVTQMTKRGKFEELTLKKASFWCYKRQTSISEQWSSSEEDRLQEDNPERKMEKIEIWSGGFSGGDASGVWNTRPQWIAPAVLLHARGIEFQRILKWGREGVMATEISIGRDLLFFLLKLWLITTILHVANSVKNQHERRSSRWQILYFYFTRYILETNFSNWHEWPPFEYFGLWDINISH